MMGKTKAEGTTGGAVLRRMILVLAVAAMLTVTAAMTMPSQALAAQPLYTCFNESTGTTISDVAPSSKHTFEKAGFTCVKKVIVS